jgi:hypothetical protein
MKYARVHCLYSEQYLLLQFYFCTPDLITVSTGFFYHFYFLQFCQKSNLIRVKQNTELWMSTEILNLIKESDELLLKYRKSNNSEDHKTFFFNFVRKVI